MELLRVFNVTELIPWLVDFSGLLLLLVSTFLKKTFQ